MQAIVHECSHQPNHEGSIVSPILHMRKLRLRERKITCPMTRLASSGVRISIHAFLFLLLPSFLPPQPIGYCLAIQIFRVWGTDSIPLTEPLCLPPEPLRALGWLSQEPKSLSAPLPCPTPAHHFVVDFMEMNFTHFLHDVFTLKRDKSEA